MSTPTRPQRAAFSRRRLFGLVAAAMVSPAIPVFTQTVKRSGLRIVKDPGTEVGSELEWVRLTFKQPTSWTRVSGYSQYRCDQTGEVFTFNWAKTS